jgi:hypothetical protein
MKRLKIFLAVVLVMFGIYLPLDAYAYNHGPGLVQAPLITQTLKKAGVASVWNTATKFQIRVTPTESWQIRDVKVYVGAQPVPATKKGKLIPGKFPYREEQAMSNSDYILTLDLKDNLGFSWGEPYEALRVQNISIFANIVKLDEAGTVVDGGACWAYTGKGASAELGEYEDELYAEFEGVGAGWWFSYLLAHPKRGHFVDSPVGGVSFSTPSISGLTDEAGAFDFFPNEKVSLALGKFSLGSTVAAHRISPLDLFEQADSSSTNVVNMARLLQSLDLDGNAKNGIRIAPEVTTMFETAMTEQGLTTLDFNNSDEIDAVISATVTKAQTASLPLVVVSAAEAQDHLEDQLNSAMFRKNVSKTPELASTKAKMNDMRIWFPAMNAKGELTPLSYYDEEGNYIREEKNAKPLFITYTDQDPVTGAADVWAAVSRDDGATWKRTNLSRSADRSSFKLANGTDFYGDTRKPVMQIQGNNVLVAWSSKFCSGGKPRYAIKIDDPATPEQEDDYSYDNPYYSDDIWGVGGPQRSHDYTADGFPEVGELPYSCVWVARGIVATQKNVSAGVGSYVGDIVWFKPERLTSGRRDALQLFLGGGDGAGMALIWQEDPAGLRPGKFVGPGHGWSGATTNHKTDIWYSYITLPDFAKVDTNFVSGGDPEHDFTDEDWIGRRKSLVPMSLPVRISDNDVVNTDNLMVELDGTGYPVVGEDGKWIPLPNETAESGEGDGTHRYGYMVPNLCSSFYEFTNEQGALKKVCITADGRLLDGDTGASRPNLFLQPYNYTVTGDNPATSAVETSYTVNSAWAIINYEETKGAGSGAPDTAGTGEQPEDGTGLGGDSYLIEQGKNVIYHSFDFRKPDVVSAGNILNLPERDASGAIQYLKDEAGVPVLDYLGRQQLAYENARRARFILQGKSGMGLNRTIMTILYKEGLEGSGRPSDIFLRRAFVPSTDKATDNPYRFTNIVCEEWIQAPDGKQVCSKGAQNISTVTPTMTTASMGDPTSEDPYGAIKVVQWQQTPDNLDDSSSLNPYEDARAHRGAMRGDFIMLGYSYTPNWAAARNGNDKYDFFVRRSFDGGKTWTTDPTGSGVTHCQVFKTLAADGSLQKDTAGDIVKQEICTTYAAGAFEQARNASQLPNAKSSVIEPRIVAPPAGKVWDATVAANTDGSLAESNKTTHPEDVFNGNVVYLAYGTSTNPKKDPVTGEQADAVPQDLFYTFTQDNGETLVQDQWEVNPESDGSYAGQIVTRWGFLAKGDPEQGEAQLRMTPDGSKFYSLWNQDGSDGSDTWFRRIMPMEFPRNVGALTTTTP